jgi:hypothetical protein
VECFTAVIVEISTRRLSRRLVVVLVAGRVVQTNDDIRRKLLLRGLFGFVVFHDVTQLDLTGPLPRAPATFR